MRDIEEVEGRDVAPAVEYNNSRQFRGSDRVGEDGNMSAYTRSGRVQSSYAHNPKSPVQPRKYVSNPLSRETIRRRGAFLLLFYCGLPV